MWGLNRVFVRSSEAHTSLLLHDNCVLAAIVQPCERSTGEDGAQPGDDDQKHEWYGEGDGTVCRGTAEIAASLPQFPAGTVLQAQWYQVDEQTNGSDEFRAIEEQLDADMTHTAEYAFGTSAGDDRQDDTQDDHQPEAPGKTFDRCADGIAAGTPIPVGSAATGLTMLVGAGYAVLRRR